MEILFIIDVGKASTMILNEVCKYELLKKEEQEKQQEECKDAVNQRLSDKGIGGLEYRYH